MTHRQETIRARYQGYADQGMSVTEAARAMGISHNAAKKMAVKLGVDFDGKAKHVLVLPPEQQRDYFTLTHEGGYSQAEAIAILTRPKRKVTWRQAHA